MGTPRTEKAAEQKCAVQDNDQKRQPQSQGWEEGEQTWMGRAWLKKQAWVLEGLECQPRKLSLCPRGMQNWQSTGRITFWKDQPVTKPKRD